MGSSKRPAPPASPQYDAVEPWSGLAVSQRRAGQLLLMMGTAAIFIASAVGESLPLSMFAGVPSGIPAVVAGLAIGLAAFAAAWLSPPALLGWPIVVAWISAAAITAWSMVEAGPAIEAAVSTIEALVLAAASLVLIRNGTSNRALRWLLTVMLLMFGTIHLLFRPAIAGLMPDFIPFAAIWPWITGILLIASGLATLFKAFRGYALLIVAAMFLAWVPLIHVPRLLASFSIGEVTFAAMAIALAGSLIICRATECLDPKRAPHRVLTLNPD
ncbi:MAG: hypothetical protein ACJ8E9_04735 [Sphingomicrobium sp.]